MARTATADLMEASSDALRHAFASLGLTARRGGGAPAHLDLDIDGRALSLKVVARAVARPDDVALGRPTDTEPGRTDTVVVADLIPEQTRIALDEAGVGWLDRRGHLRLRADGIRIDADVPADPRHVLRGTPDTGAAALSWAVALLCSPEEPPAMRAVARRADLAVSGISKAAGRLREAALVKRDGKPLVPELFWAVANRWSPERVPIAAVPSPGDLDGPVLIGSTVAAAAWGAPVVVGAEYPADLYVASPSDLRRVVRRCGDAPFDGRAATVAVAPTPLVLQPEHSRISRSFPVVDPVIAALDLAVDRARGLEILDGWNPDVGRRVW